MNDAVNLETPNATEPQTLEDVRALSYEGWLEAILLVARHHRLDYVVGRARRLAVGPSRRMASARPGSVLSRRRPCLDRAVEAGIAMDRDWTFQTLIWLGLPPLG